MIQALRTPEEHFRDLPDFPYSPIYIESLKDYKGLRMHYVDEGPQDAENVFLVTIQPLRHQTTKKRH